MEDRDKVTHFRIQSSLYLLSLIQQTLMESSNESLDDENEMIAVMMTRITG
jgi:hypothetical protein